MDIGDLEHSGFDCLDLVAEAWGGDHDRRVRSFGDLDLVLADADCFNDDRVEAAQIENIDGVECRAGHASHAPRVAMLRI
ncbi:MAG: hypothetical protein WDN31_04030 [Hyphomicrobium sp.]